MTKHLRLLGVFCGMLTLALMTPPVMGQKADSKDIEKTITQMENDNAKSRQAGNGDYTKMLADDFSGATSWGAWETKQELEKDAADTKNNKTTKWEVSEMKVRVYGDNTAIATFRTSYDALIKGQHRARTILTTDTWVNDNGTWKMAATHSSQAGQKIGD